MLSPGTQDNNAVSIEAGETTWSESHLAEAHFDAGLTES